MIKLQLKNVIFTQDLNEYISYDIKPNFKVCGPILGKNIKEFQDKLKDFTQDNISTLENGNTITLNISGNDIDITYDMLETFDIDSVIFTYLGDNTYAIKFARCGTYEKFYGITDNNDERENL